MTIYYVNTGSSPNAGDGDSLRVAFTKINSNFATLENSIANINTGTGTNYVLPVATTSTLGGIKIDGHTLLITDGVARVAAAANFHFSNNIILNGNGATISNSQGFGTSTALISIPAYNSTATIRLQNHSGTVTIDVRSLDGIHRHWEFDQTGTLNTPGSIVPKTDLEYDLGSPTNQWRSLYVGTSTIYIGGVPLRINTASNTLVIGADTSVTTAVNLATETYVQEYVTQRTEIDGGNAFTVYIAEMIIDGGGA